MNYKTFMIMVFKSIIKIMAKVYYLHIKRDNVAFARYMGVRVGQHCQILANPSMAFGTEPWLIKLGDHVDITAGVTFLNHEGAMWCVRGMNEQYRNDDMFRPITVGNNVMIGVNSLIMPGVRIGNNVIIAGHSVVTRDVPDGAIVAGVPAKQISSLESFIDKLKDKELFPTKKMTSEQKRQYLMIHHPEWFE